MDDEETIHTTVAFALEMFGYELTSAYSGEEALQTYKASLDKGDPFDVVIMDLTIPGGMGGEEAITKLLEIDAKALAIVTSGYSNDAVMIHYEDYGFKGRLKKPVSLSELAQEIKRVMSISSIA